MNVLMISGDKNLLNPESEAGKRLALQRAQVDRLDVFVWPQEHSYRTILHAASKTHYDRVTVQDPFWRGLIALLVARKAKALLNVQVHADLSAQSLLRRLIARIVLRQASSVRVVSEKVKKQVESATKRVPIHVLPLHVDLSRFKDLKRVQHDRPLILWVGRFEKEKDPLRALEVLKQVRADGIDAALVMLGAGALESELHKVARDLPVEFPGWRPPEEYLPLADVALCTSPYESWGASIIEALAAGVPVVAADVGIAREAGAIVVATRAGLATAVTTVLREKPAGRLQIGFLDKEEWGKRWRAALA